MIGSGPWVRHHPKDSRKWIKDPLSWSPCAENIVSRIKKNLKSFHKIYPYWRIRKKFLKFVEEILAKFYIDVNKRLSKLFSLRLNKRKTF